MDEQMAREILKDYIFGDTGLLNACFPYINWSKGNEKTTLDGNFSAIELKALAWWMENMQ